MTEPAVLIELGNKPADDELFKTARELATGDSELMARAEELIRRNPTRAQMHVLLEDLRRESQVRQVNAAAIALCAALGNAHPTTTEKLLALQVQMLQEQADLLRRVANRGSSSSTKADSGGFASAGILGLLIAGFGLR